MAKEMLRPSEVVARIGLSRTTIWRGVRAGTFPAPLELGRNSIGWPESVIDDWLDRQAEGARLKRPGKGRPERDKLHEQELGQKGEFLYARDDQQGNEKDAEWDCPEAEPGGGRGCGRRARCGIGHYRRRMRGIFSEF